MKKRFSEEQRWCKIISVNSKSIMLKRKNIMPQKSKQQISDRTFSPVE